MEEGLHQRRSEVNVADGGDHGVVEMVDVVGYEVGQGRVLGVTPQSLEPPDNASIIRLMVRKCPLPVIP